MLERQGNRLIGDSWEELGLDIPASKYNSSQDVKLRHCPECKDKGKRKSNDFSVSVNPAEGIGKCHKCGTTFVIRKEQKKVEKTFTPPSRENLTKLSDAGLQFFVNRRISQEAVNHFKVAQRGDWVAYPYFFNGTLVNIKYKNIHEKKYTQSPNGMHVMHNYDEAKKYNVVIVTEGEEEDLCWFDAGHPYAVSVDAGAPNPNDQIEKKLECITNCFDLFEQADVIYIAVDNDDNGRRLQAELIRRFNTEKIRLVDFGKYKDANEVVMHEGREALNALLKSAKEVKMDGIFTVDDVRDRMWDMYHNGLPKGTTTYFPSIDKVWKWREGEVTTGTGYGNEGKSAVLDVNLPLVKAVKEGWKVGLFIPENFPTEYFFEDVVHTYLGKTTDKDYPAYRCTPEEYQKGLDFVNAHFFTVYPSETPTLEAIFERMDYLVRKHGIRIMVIDPFNMVENLWDGRITYDLYVSRFMTALVNFTAKRRLHTILVAHQGKPDKKLQNGNWPPPDPYAVKGGGTFFDKTTNMISIYRPFRLTDKKNPLVLFESLKLKWKKHMMADTDVAEIFFNWKTNRYEDAALAMNSPLAVNRFENQSSPQGDDEDETPIPF